MKDTIEINSASLQGTKPLEVVYPPVVTETMLKNAQKALATLESHFPECNTGINLHLGEVINTNQVEQSGVNVTSMDVPDIGYPSEFAQKLVSRPEQLVGHIAWRINSTLGLTMQQAQKRRLSRLGNTQNLQPFSSEPFIRVSAESNPKTDKPDTKLIEDIAKIFPSGLIAVEYNAEEMTVDEYIRLITRLRQENSNIGFSMDLAHIYEHFKITEGRESNSATEATLNLWTEILKKEPSSILSIDINNINPDTKNYGETHTGILTPGGAIPMGSVVQEYRKNLTRYPTIQGRLAIEPSPWQSKMLVDSEGSAFLLSQIESFEK